ncbi:MAG: hypothetical protein HFH09_04735 [Bacilli bacterium]|jgi:hypothetical protein|nr:hypothetical protein [Bacilli bacterium]
MVEEIEAVLNGNQNLTQDLKMNFLELVVIFQKQFPTISLENLKNRLQTLKIDKLNRYVSSEVSKYDPVLNTLMINEERLVKDVDAKHVLMYELLSMITAKDNYTGFNFNHQFEALNIGYTEILTNYLVGNETEDFVHADEIVATNLISISIGNDILLHAFFNNDYMTLTKSLIDAGIEL